MEGLDPSFKVKYLTKLITTFSTSTVMVNIQYVVDRIFIH